MPAVTGQASSLAGWLVAQADARPDVPFLIFEGARWSYAEVAAQSRALACSLRDLGVETGDRVALDMPNWPEFVVAALAAARLGAVIVPLSPLHSHRELHFVLRNTEATIAVTAERFGGTEFLEMYESMLPQLPSLQYLATVGVEDLWYDDRIFQFEDLVSAGRGQVMQPPEVRADDTAAILFTAGMSGKQKGVVLTHGNLLRTARATADGFGLTQQDITLCAVPLYNIFGLGTALLTTLMTGSTLVLQEAFSAERSLELIEEYGITVVHGVPTMFVLLERAASSGRYDTSTLRSGIIAGAPVDGDLIRRLRGELVPHLEIAYGLTETSPTVSITRSADEEPERSESVGRPIPGIEVEILDEDHAPVDEGEPGEVAVRGFNVMAGYFRQPEATRATMTESGYLLTGDFGTLDAAGFLRITGRQSDIIIRGGYGVHPQEVEHHLLAHPALASAVVVGVPDEVLGEFICACVVPLEGALVSEMEIREYCRSALADSKVPDTVVLLDEIPMTSRGKTSRAELARMVRDGTVKRRAETGEEVGAEEAIPDPPAEQD